MIKEQWQTLHDNLLSLLEQFEALYYTVRIEDRLSTNKKRNENSSKLNQIVNEGYWTIVNNAEALELYIGEIEFGDEEYYKRQALNNEESFASQVQEFLRIIKATKLNLPSV